MDSLPDELVQLLADNVPDVRAMVAVSCRFRDLLSARDDVTIWRKPPHIQMAQIPQKMFGLITFSRNNILIDGSAELIRWYAPWEPLDLCTVLYNPSPAAFDCMIEYMVNANHIDPQKTLFGGIPWASNLVYIVLSDGDAAPFATLFRMFPLWRPVMERLARESGVEWMIPADFCGKK